MGRIRIYAHWQKYTRRKSLQYMRISVSFHHMISSINYHNLHLSLSFIVHSSIFIYSFAYILFLYIVCYRLVYLYLCYIIVWGSQQCAIVNISSWKLTVKLLSIKKMDRLLLRRIWIIWINKRRKRYRKKRGRLKCRKIRNFKILFRISLKRRKGGSVSLLKKKIKRRRRFSQVPCRWNPDNLKNNKWWKNLSMNQERKNKSI